MPNIHDYSKIETIVIEHYTVEKKIIKNFFSKKEYFIENLVDKRTETYQGGELVLYEEFLYNHPCLHEHGVRVAENNGYRWEIEYNWGNENIPTKIINHYDNKGYHIKSFFTSYSSNSTMPDTSISTYKYQFSEQGKLIQISEYNSGNILKSTEKREYNSMGECIKLIEESYENQKTQKIVTTFFEYENNYVSKETETTQILYQTSIHEKNHKSTTFYNRNRYGDVTYKKIHYVDSGKIIENHYQLQYDAHNNCTECKCKVFENGEFKRETLWRYKIKYKL